MGGRGGSSGFSSSDGVIQNAKPRTIETVYREANGRSAGYFKDEVLEAKTGGKGNVTFSYAKADSYNKTAKTNRTNYVSYTLKAGAVNGETFGINWNNVKSISGQTYGLRKAAKENGLKFDGKTKSWKR